jgi:hypothetical protein
LYKFLIEIIQMELKYSRSRKCTAKWCHQGKCH